MKKLKNISIILLILIGCIAFSIGVSACKPSEEKKEDVKLYLISSEYDLEVGESTQIRIEYAGEKVITYSSANIDIVSVTPDGKIQGVNSGTTYVSASVEKQIVTCKVTVIDNEYSVFLPYENINVVVGSEIDFIAETRKNNIAYNDSVEWTLDDTDGAIITSSGNKVMFKAISVGEYVLTATTDKASNECKIRVVTEDAKRLATPNITINHCDTVSWTEIDGADKYAVSINGENWKTITETSCSFTDISDEMIAGEKLSVSVKALAGNNFSFIDSYIVGLSVEHDFTIEELTEATCFISGKAKYTCKDCARNYTVEEYTEEHTFDNNHVCTKCKSERTSAFFYAYDEKLDCYYVTGVKSKNYQVAYISGWHDDGVHGYKAVKYVAQRAFIDNASITHLLFPENVTMLYGDAFLRCTELQYLDLGGISTFKLYYNGKPTAPDYTDMTEEEAAIAKSEYEKELKDKYTGFNQVLACDKLETLVIKQGLICDEQAFLYSSLAKEHNRMTIYAKEEGGTIVLCNTNMWNGKLLQYDETGETCSSWRYAENGYEIEKSVDHHYRNGKCKYCGKYDPTEFITYEYDQKADCYYVGDSTEYLKDTVIVAEKYDDGVHGEKLVEYVANTAFKGNLNIKKVILPITLKVIGGNAFSGCTSLEYLEMPGVEDISSPSATWFTSRYSKFERATQAYSTFSGTSLKTLIVGESFNVQEPQFNTANVEGITRIYSTKTTPVEWIDGASTPYGLQAGINKMFITTFSSPMKSPIYFYSEKMPTDKSYIFWHYVDGVPTIWTEYADGPDFVDEQGVTYGYDTKADCYYVAGNRTLSVESIVIPQKYNDGVHGEKFVMYVADSAFNGNAYIKKVILPVTLKVIGGAAFTNCTALKYLEMPGVEDVSSPSATWFANRYSQFEKATQYYDTFRNAPIEILVLGDAFNVQESQFSCANISGITRIYSTKTTPVEFGDKAPYGLYSNPMFITTYESTLKSPIYFYSEEKPTDKSYIFWHYVNGVATVWTEYAE